MNENRFNEDCKIFEELISEGKDLTENAQSIRGGSLDDAPKSEQNCTRWFVTTRNFLISLFGEGDLDIHMFRKSFSKRYQSMNLMGLYSGDWKFVQEDMCKGVGVLEGIYYSFKKGIKQRKEELIKELKKSKDRIKVMFDNNILNKIVEGELDIEKIKKSDKFEFYATHIQTDEASNCNDENRRAMLVLNLTKLSPIIISTESAIFGTSRLGECKFGDGKTIENLRQGNNKHTKDALIGEVAIKKGIVLVTNDKTLKSRVNTNSGRAIDLEEFKELI
jgi:rRNA-processing protein FCF1